jgi:hypothetical protein
MRVYGCVLLLALLGCGETRCEDLTPEPLVGFYRAGLTLGKERMLRASIDVLEKEVHLNFTTPDGSRIRAKYRVTKKRKVVE